MPNFWVEPSAAIGALKTKLIGRLMPLLLRTLAAFAPSIVRIILPFYDALLSMLKGRESTYKRSLRQKSKRAAMDNDYMLQVLSSCFIDNTLAPADSLCQA